MHEYCGRYQSMNQCVCGVKDAQQPIQLDLHVLIKAYTLRHTITSIPAQTIPVVLCVQEILLVHRHAEALLLREEPAPERAQVKGKSGHVCFPGTPLSCNSALCPGSCDVLHVLFVPIVNAEPAVVQHKWQFDVGLQAWHSPVREHVRVGHPVVVAQAVARRAFPA